MFLDAPLYNSWGTAHAGRGSSLRIKLTGYSSPKRTHRQQRVTKSVPVLLLLIQHGANGPNLLEAQHVVLVEPLPNPAAEAQAVSRVHRIGQEKRTLVHRFIVCSFPFFLSFCVFCKLILDAKHLRFFSFEIHNLTTLKIAWGICWK